MVSAWLELPDAMSVALSAGVRFGVQVTFAVIGFIEKPPEPRRGGTERRSSSS
jgi:hypothetical protein